jgi:AbiTii-like protein
MTLLRTIQDAAVGGTESITALLRRCKILAARLGSTEFGDWVERELNGYTEKQQLPAYRIITVRSLGHFAGPFGSGLRNASIPRSAIPKEYRDWVDVSNMMQPIGAYEDLLRSGKTGSFEAPWPADLVALVGQDIYEHMNCLGAWQAIPRGAVVALLDTVRNKVLNFALEIERLSPNAGEAPPGAPTIASERVQQVFHTNIYGNVGNVASGAVNPQQSIGTMVTHEDFSSLARQLGALGITDSEIEDLKAAIEGDRRQGKPTFGHRIGEWCGKMLGKAGQGALKVTVDVAATVVPKLISRYLGLPE